MGRVVGKHSLKMEKESWSVYLGNYLVWEVTVSAAWRPQKFRLPKLLRPVSSRMVGAQPVSSCLVGSLSKAWLVGGVPNDA